MPYHEEDWLHRRHHQQKPDTLKLSQYEKEAHREIENWQRSEGSVLAQAMNWAMKPLDWAVERILPAQMVEQAGEAVSGFLSLLNDASEWTYDAADILKQAAAAGIEAGRVEMLRDAPLERIDPIARSQCTPNAIFAAIEGGGAGLGGAVLIIADIPLLFTLNFRLIQQIGTSYGFPMRGPSFRPIVLSIYNVAASGSRDAKHDACREISVAAAAFAHDQPYKGRVKGVFRDQNRHLPREIGKNLLGRKIGQAIPVAGAAVGAGINYWFTTETAEAAYMLFRALHLERRDRL